MRILAAGAGALRRLLDLLLIGLILVVLGGVMLGKLVPLTGRQTLIIGGPSMEPAIPLGSAIVIERVTPDALSVGQIVSLQAGPDDAVFTHRIIEIVDTADGRWVRTKGDNNDAPDPTLVPTSAILGRVGWSIPLAGYLLALLSLPTGILFLLGLAAILLASAWLLESLELERDVPQPGPGTDDVAPSRRRPIVPAAVGEPIAARPGPPFAFAAQPAYGTPTGTAYGTGYATASLAVPERIAAVRDRRRRRDRWQAAPRAADPSSGGGDARGGDPA